MRASGRHPNPDSRWGAGVALQRTMVIASAARVIAV
jgi:hypothetical protein